MLTPSPSKNGEISLPLHLQNFYACTTHINGSKSLPVATIDSVL